MVHDVHVPHTTKLNKPMVHRLAPANGLKVFCRPKAMPTHSNDMSTCVLVFVRTTMCLGPKPAGQRITKRKTWCRRESSEPLQTRPSRICGPRWFGRSYPGGKDTTPRTRLTPAWSATGQQGTARHSKDTTRRTARLRGRTEATAVVKNRSHRGAGHRSRAWCRHRRPGARQAKRMRRFGGTRKQPRAELKPVAWRPVPCFWPVGGL